MAMQSSFLGLAILGLPLVSSLEGADSKITKEELIPIMEALNSDYLVEVDLDPKVFDFDPEADMKKKEKAADTATIKFISKVLYPNDKKTEVAALDIPAPNSATQTMVFIPGQNVQVEGVVRDYERAPVSRVRQDGVLINASYPRENTLSAFDRPGYRSEVKGFHIDRHAVTNKEYAAFLTATRRMPPFHWNQGKPPAGWDNQPVVNVTYDDALAYAAWAGKRLPRFSEYERALRVAYGLRTGSPVMEWTSTPSNPGQQPERVYRYGGIPGTKSQYDQQTGFRTAMDE